MRDVRTPGPRFRALDDSRDPSPYVTPVGEADPLAVAAFWERALDALGLDPAMPAPAASCFGDMVELADELIGLVLAGTKRATASSLEHLETDGEPVPQVGGLWIATDGAMRARALLETTDVRIGPLSSVDARSPATRVRATARAPAGWTPTPGTSLAPSPRPAWRSIRTCRWCSNDSRSATRSLESNEQPR
jgi:ASCH domain